MNITQIRQMSHHNAHDLIIRYQKTGDEKIFAVLLAKYDDLLLRALHDYMHLNTYMSRDPLQELYHIAVIGFANCIKSVPQKENPNILPGRIKRYVEAAFRAAYKAQTSDYTFCKTHGSVMTSRYSGRDENFTETQNKADVDIVLKSAGLTKEEKSIVKMYYIKEMTMNEIHQKCGLSVAAVSNRLNTAMKKLRSQVGVNSEFKG